MNKKLVLGLLLIPAGAILFSACGPMEDVGNNDMGLDQASDQFYGAQIPCSEYGRCNDGWDNDGNGLTDMADPACHVLKPIRDLSLYPFPVGHNFAPDITKIPPGGPGFPGGFRDYAQITRWMRFLTEADGQTAGIDLYGAAANSPAVPVPAPLYPKPLQGTWHQGNNNNVNAFAFPQAPGPMGAVDAAIPDMFQPANPNGTREGRFFNNRIFHGYHGDLKNRN